MGEWVKLTASDGAELSAYIARPTGEPKASLIVVQEIFGINEHIRSVADDWANEGFLVIAPALFDRIEKDVFLDYSEEGWASAMTYYPKLDPAKSALDINAAISWLHDVADKPVGVVGYCYGGTMAWVSACRLRIEAAVGYYGGGIVGFASEHPHCPVMLHFGGADTHIAPESIAKIQFAHPEVPIFVYEGAGHAFNRSADPKAFVAEASRLAKARSLLFFQQHLVF